MVTKLLNLISNILTKKARLAVKVPSGYRVVKFDWNYEDEFDLLLPDEPKLLFDPRYSTSIYLKPLFMGAVDWINDYFSSSSYKSSITEHYFIRFVCDSNASVVLSAQFFNTDIYKARGALTKMKNLSFYIFQRAYMDALKFPREGKLNENDTFFCLDSVSMEIVKNGIGKACRVVPLPTLRGLLSLESHRAYIQTDSRVIGYISQRKDNIVREKPSFYELEELHLNKLAKTINNLGYTFAIVGVTNEQSEFDFYQRVLEGIVDWSFMPRTEYYSSYETAKSLALIISPGSSFGFETMASGIRTVFYTYEPSAKFMREAKTSGRQNLRSDSKDVSQGGGLALYGEDSSRDLATKIKKVLTLSPSSFSRMAEFELGFRSEDANLEDYRKPIMDSLAKVTS